MVSAYENVDLTRFETALRTPRAIDHRSSRIGHVQVHPGLSLLSVDLKVTRPAEILSETFPAVCMSIVLDGYAEGRMGSLETGFRPGEFWIASTNDRVSTQKIISPSHPVRTVELVVTSEWFDFAQERYGDDQSLDDMRRTVRKPTNTRRGPLDARLRRLAWSIQNPPAGGFAESLFLEARALDLLALLAAECQGDATRLRPAPLNGRGMERIVAVREFIDQDPAAASTISALAERFSMSPSKLKQDFAVAFGICPGTYINDRRLLLGRELIERHAMSVSEAAYRAGYAHPGNFTAAFKRRFGYPPSTIKRFS